MPDTASGLLASARTWKRVQLLPHAGSESRGEPRLVPTDEPDHLAQALRYRSNGKSSFES